MKQSKTSLRTFAKYLLAYKGRITLVFLLLVFAKVFLVGAPIFLKGIVDELQKNFGDPSSWETIVYLILMFFGFSAMGTVCNEIKEYLFTKVEVRIVRKSARDVFVHLMNLPLAFHLSKKTGSVANKIERGVRGMEMVFRLLLFNVVPTLVEITLVLAVLFYLYDFTFGLLTFFILISYIFFTIFITEKRVVVQRKLNKYNVEANAKSIDSIINYETVKYFTNEKLEKERFDATLKKVEQTNLQFKNFLYLTNIGQQGIVTIGIVGLLFMVSWNVLHGTMTLGDLTLITLFLRQVSTPLNFLGFIYRQVKENLVNIEDMFGIINIESSIQDSKDALDIQKFSKGIVFKDVSFSYDEKRTVLHDVNFEIEKGKTVALVGPSGSGKSSITRLLFRFYDTSGGDVTIDGHNVKEVSQHSLRDLIGFVPQDTVLFNDTIFYNIAYGKPGASKEDVYEAARIANMHEFIESLPDGYNTVVGERGLRLSGGEKQRVAIARVVLKNSPILVFDEATSSLDSRVESIIQDSIKKLSKSKTVIIIAHRLSTVVDADSILVLEKGHVKERGTHKSLLAKKGLYAHLWDLQKKEED